jgi:signal transduction histidine kinase
MKYYPNPLFVLTLLLFCYLTGSAASISYFYLEDSTSGLSHKQVATAPAEQFSILPKNTLTKKFEQHPFWLKITLDSSLSDRVLLIENSHLDSVDVFIYDGNNLLKSYHSGDLRPFETRELNFIFFNFIIPANADQVLVRAQNKGLLLVPTQIMTFKEYFNYQQKYSFFHWFYFGFVILAIVTSLLFFIWLKESIYFYYLLGVMSIGFLTAVDFGYTFQLFWPEHPEINRFNSSFYCMSFFILIFVEKLLNIKNHFPKLYLFFILLYVVHAINLIFSLLGLYHLSIQITYYTTVVVPTLSIFAGILSLIKVRSHSAQFFLIGWAMYLISIFVYSAALNGFVEYNLFTSNAIQIGSSIEILFLNLAILSKIQTLKKEKEILLFEQNKMLEEKVLLRTLELSEKNDEILAQNEELQNQHTELEAQRDTLEAQNNIIEEQNLLLKDNQVYLEKLVHKRTDDLSKVNHELTDKNNRLEQFAFVAAHNLRGPVATLLGLAGIYNKEQPADPINLVIIDKSKETIHRLDSIIKDLVTILDLQKSSQMLLEDVPLLKVLEDVKVLLSREIETAGAIIEHNFTSAATFLCIPVYLNNIFYNLVSNSIKYGRDNIPPHVVIEFQETSDYSSFTFSDNGKGIDLDMYKDNLFRPYKRFHLEKEGKGLGLYIIKTQVEIMKGTINVSSIPNEGTRFVLVFPKK